MKQAMPFSSGLTTFPRIQASRSVGTVMKNEGFCKESLILCWAILLQGYVSGDVISFGVDGEDVYVDCISGNIEISPPKASNGRYVQIGGTAIYYDILPPCSNAAPPIYLYRDHDTDSLCIAASQKLVPATHIPTICSQLASIIQSKPANVQKFCAASLRTTSLSIVNHPPQVLPGPQLLHQLLLKSDLSESNGENILALEFLNSELDTRISFSYSDLDRLSTRFAQKLYFELQGRRIVPVLLPQSPQLYIALLGILKAGGAFAPLQLDAPVERIKFVVRDVEAAVIVADPSLLEKVTWEGGPRVIVADGSDLQNVGGFQFQNLAALPVESIHPHNPAYVMYTSGSTGTPKGVTISHSAVTQSLLAHEKHIPAYERFLQFASPTFDVFVFEVFFTFFRGATLIGCDRSLLLSNLVSVINQMEVDAMELTPTVLGELVVSKGRIPRVRTILTIGEMLTRNIIDEFGDSLLHGMYGPTEAAIHCTLLMSFPKSGGVGDIGIPLDTVSAFILGPQNPDGRTDILPIGWIGELAVGGYQLADGYLNRPELTKGSFIDTPYGKLYRTGDRARIHPSGTIECFGRMATGQVKLRGQRIELGEIEEAIRKGADVKGVVASVFSGSLVVFVGAGNYVTENMVRDAAKRWLPGYMVPNTIIILEEIPRLSSGKADRKKLEQDFLQGRFKRVDEARADTMNETEKIIACVLEEMIGVSIPKNTSLISSGLDSLLAIRACSKLREKGLAVQTADILRTDSVEGLARTLSLNSNQQDAQGSATGANTEPIFENVFQAGKAKLSELLKDNFGSVGDILPCTTVQEMMLAETMRDAVAYSNWILLELEPTYTESHIESAFRKLIRRNEMLRTGFLPLQHQQGQFLQIVWDGPHQNQFIRSEFIEPSHQFNIDSMLIPPFRACMVVHEGVTKLSIHIHHALYDGWAWEQIVTEFDALLRQDWVNLINKRPSFKEVVQHNLSRSNAQLEKCQTFWESLLSGASSSKIPNFHGCTGLAPGTSKEGIVLRTSRNVLEAAARRLGISPQVILQTAWGYLLGSFLNSSDVIFGTVLSGRTIPIRNIEHVIGPCLSTVPMRVKLGEKGKKCTEVMKEVHILNMDILAHSGLELRKIKKLCREGSGSFDTLLVWQQTLAGKDSTNTCTLKQIDSRDHLEFSLLLEVEPSEAKITLNATFKVQTLPQLQVTHILSQLDQLVATIVASPEITLHTLSSHLDESTLSVYNPRPSVPTITENPSLPSLVQKTVALFPNAAALEFLHELKGKFARIEKVTYAELNNASNKLAHKLINMGVVQDQLVCVCMEKSPNLYISILAILKAGAGYLPLTPDTPPDRIARILENAATKIVISTSDTSNKLRVGEDVAVINVDLQELDSLPTTNPDVVISSSSLAYAVFTSGSTGIPKGVLVTQENIVTNILALQDIYPYSQKSKLLQSCSQSFDVSVFEIFFTWSTGMSLCSGTKDTLLRDLEAAINGFGVTHLSLTPTVAALIDPQEVPSVGFLVTAGEAVTPKVFNNWAGRGLYQGYGPSETTNICTVKARVQKSDTINNLGPSFTNTSTFVLSPEDEFNIVPRGGIGELCFGGSQVARGYLNMPELTARKFITHPVYGRIYRSGDIGRLLPSGDIEFVGRQDDQVKIRGLRIELGEITSVLLQKQQVLDATTLTIAGDGRSSLQLVSFVVLKNFNDQNNDCGVPSPTSEITTIIQQLFKEISAFLTAYMVPSTLLPITKLPMTTQGKIDRRTLERLYREMDSQALAAFSEGYVEQSTDAMEEWTQTERKIAEIIAKIAGVSLNEVRKFTSIFRLGLDSISAIYLSSEIAKLGLKRLDVSQIMRNPNTASLAVLASDEEIQEPKAKTENIFDMFEHSIREHVLHELRLSDNDITAILPCTPLQEAMLAERKAENAASYYNHTVFNLQADPSRLEGAWDIVVKRNDILRTCFCVTNHTRHAYAQVVLKDYSLPWTSIQLALDENLMEAVHEKITADSMGLKVNRPPYCFTLFSTPNRHMLLMSTHHSLYDGFAMDLLLEEVRMAYHRMPLPTRTSFRDVLQYIYSYDLEAADLFWKTTMKDFEPSQFPDLTGKSNSHRANLIGMATSTYRSSQSLASIEDGCKKLSTSLLACGQSAWAQLLAIYTGEEDLCFGNVVSGRTIPVAGVESVIAPCFNTIPMRIRLSSAYTHATFMEAVQLANTEAMPFQLTPLRRIMTALHTDGQMLFDTLFILQYSRESQKADQLWKVIEDWGEMDFAVVVELVPSRNENVLDFVLHFRRNIMDEQTANIILQQLDQTLRASLVHPERLIHNFDHLDISLLSICNSPPQILPETGDILLHTLFENHACKKPNATALEFVYDSGHLSTWTYEAMNIAANEIAHLLLSYGTARDEAIPICIEKSPQYYISVLAVLKAGSAFTPIDPSTPAQRKSFMLGELGARIVLTNTKCSGNLIVKEGVKLILLDMCDLGTQPKSNPIVPNLATNNLAYRLYTSGSTGVPKAVSIEIKSALQTIRASRTIIPWYETSRLLQFAATTFDMCYYDCFMAWNYGFTLCSAGRKKLLGDLEGTIKELRVTMLDLTPTVAATLNAKNLPVVELLYCIGEAMPQSLVQDWEGRCVNSYGPTEAAMCCTILPVNQSVKAINIGKPFCTASFTILPRTTEHIVPVLGLGELCIGGDQVAREYYKNPDLTCEKFLTIGSERVYRTGDNVRMLANGTFEFIGRLDDQVKIRGLRVELDEISNVLRKSHGDITEVSTLVLRYSAETKEQLVSFLSVGGRRQPGALPSVLIGSRATDIRSAAREAAGKSLPTYMVPSVILVIDHIPQSAAGKVDRKALATLFSKQEIESLSPSEEQNGEEWTEAELGARRVLAKISQTPEEKVSKSSTIYQLGLDSISAAQVAIGLRKIGYELTVIDILECPSIKQLSSRLVKPSNSAINGTTATVNGETKLQYLIGFATRFMKSIITEYSLSIDQIEATYPCTPTQAGMLSQFVRSNGDLYFNHALLQLSLDIDIQRLKQAWEHLMIQNEILRAGFFAIDDDEHHFVTVIYKKEKVELPWTVFRPPSKATNGCINEQKRFRTAHAVENLGVLPWHLTLILEPANNGNTYLLFSAHHALYDAKSLKMMLDDVLAYYSKSESRLHPPFKKALNSIIGESFDFTKFEAGRNFWSKQLEGGNICKFPKLTNTVININTSHVISHPSSWKVSAIEKASQTLGFSVNAVAQAAYIRVLSTYIGEPKVIFGSVISGRTGLQDAEDVMFPCLTTVPMSGTVAGSNRDLVEQTQENITRVLPHQHTSLRAIQKWLGQSDQSFFDTIFVYQKTGASTNNDAQSIWTIVEEDAYVDYPISIEIEPTENDTLVIRATCKDNVIPPQQSRLLVQQIDAALIDILENPQRDCADLSNIPAQLLSITPPIVREIPTKVKLLHQFVELHSDTIPNKVALEFASSISESRVEKQQWTYKELEHESNKIANFLLGQGVKTGNLVAICFDKCAEASFAIIGILKAGCGYVALDPSAPIDRKAFIVRDSGACCILTMDGFKGDLKKNVDVGVFSVSSEENIQHSSMKRPFVADLIPSGLCYCLYTSGTTGTPKGCEITHENTVQAMLAFTRIFKGHWDAESRFLQFASFHFDVSVLEQFWSWSVGICVTSTPRDVLFEDLPLAIRKLEITHLDLTPSLAVLLKPEEVPSLLRGVFIVGGEALRQDVLDTWGPHGVLHNGYGPTEVTIGCTMLPRVPKDGKPSNIGPQFDNVGSFIMVPNTNRPTLRGALGELCVSGKLVGKGYLNRPDLTNEKFPYLTEYNERIYRTGDLVRILHNGCLHFAGRADDQVKLRGQRLEIGEINVTIKRANPRVKAVATLVLKHPKQQRDQLISFISFESTKYDKGVHELIETGEFGALIGGLLSVCKKHLPAYMVPTYLLPVTNIPLSVNNKVDNKKLAQIYKGASLETLQAMVYREEKAGIFSALELKIRKILADMTRLPESDIKRSSTIFELGLDSVSVVGLARRMKKNGLDAVTVSMVMQNSSLGKLAQALSKSTETNSNEKNKLETARQQLAAFANKNSYEIIEHLGINQDIIDKVLPCTALQEGMILRFIDSNEPLYFNSFTFELSPSTNVNLLREAWAKVIKSTEALRTCFCETPDGYAQIVLKDGNVNWVNIHLDQDQALEEILEKEKEDNARLNRTLHKPPIHFRVVHTPTRRIFALQIFHALYDGGSLPLLLKDVEKAYHSQYQSRPFQFSDVVPYIVSGDLKDAEMFWKRHLQGHQYTSFVAHTEHAGKDAFVHRAMELSGKRLEEGCRIFGCTAQSLIQAALAGVLASFVGTEITLGVVVSGRTLPLDDIDEIIGPLFNTIPCLLHLNNNTTWRSLVGQAHAFNSDSIPYHHTPLRLIRKWLRIPSDKQLFDTLFVYQKYADESVASSSLWKPVQTSAEVDYPVSIEIEQHGSGELFMTVAAKGFSLTEQKALKLILETEHSLKELLDAPDSPLTVIEWPTADHLSSKEESKPQQNGYQSQFEWTAEAKAMRSIIATLAELEETDITEDVSIFELGLDSIEAIKVSARLRRSGIQMSVSTIMRNPTIRKLNAFLRQVSTPSQKISDDTTLPDFEASCRKKFPPAMYEAIYPTTPLQEAIIAETLTSNYKHYFNHDVLELDETVDVEKLHEAWKDVIRCNPILRTSFFQTHELGFESSHAFGQVVHKNFEVPWTEAPLSPGEDLWHVLGGVIDKTTKETDLLQQPPLRLTVVKARNSRYLVLSMSHALYDGWSLSLLHEDIRWAYHKKVNVRPSPAPLLENILGGSPEDSTKFWKQILQGAEASEFPIIAAAPEQSKTNRDEVTSKMAYQKAADYCKRIGITLQTLGQTCWGLALAHYLGKADLIFGSVLSGRDGEEAEEVMFPTMNTVPVRTIVHGNYMEMLRYMQHNSGNVLKYQYTPLRMIQKLVNTDGKRLFDTLFIFQRVKAGDQEGKLYHSIRGSSDLEYNVCIEMERNGNSLIWRAASKSTVMTQKQLHDILQLLDSLIGHIVENPAAPAISYENDMVRFGNTKAVYLANRQPSPESKEENKVTSQDQVGEWSAYEIKVRKVLASVAHLPEEEVERTSTIFHIGLDSISAIRVSSELRKEHIFISVADILRYATIEKIAMAAELKTEEKVVIDTEKALKNSLDGIDITEILQAKGIGSESVARVMPATAGQVYMLSIWQNTNGSLFMPTFTFKSKRLQALRLQTAWERLVETNEILRTTFISTGQEQVPILQVIFRKSKAEFEYQQTMSDDQDTLIAVGIAREQQKEVTLERPPVRLTLVNTPTRSILLVTIHHALYDGISLPLLLKELQKTYNSLPKEESPVQSPENVENSEPSDLKPTIKESISGIEVPELAPVIEVPQINGTKLPEESAIKEVPTCPEVRAINQVLEAPATSPKIDCTDSNATPSHALLLPPPQAPSSPITFADVVGYTYSQNRSKQKHFWTKYLESATSTLLGTRFNTSKSKATERTSLFKPTLFTKSTILEEKYRKHGITLQALFLAAFSKTYANILFPRESSASISTASSSRSSSFSDMEDDNNYSSLDQDIVIGIYLSNRHLPINGTSGNLDELAAPTLNLLPLRVARPKSTNLQALAERIQRDLGDIGNAENSAGVGLADIERWTRTGGPGTGIRVDAWFNYLKLPGVEMNDAQDTDTRKVGNDEEERDEDEDWVVFEEIKPALPTSSSEWGSTPGVISSTPSVGGKMLDNNMVRDYIMTNLDIEVAVDQTGNVGVGVFARGDVLDMKEAERFVTMIGEMVLGAF